MAWIGRQPGAQVLDHPAIDGAEEVVARRGVEKLRGADPVAVVRVAVAQQHFVVQAARGLLQRLDRLEEQLEMTALGGLAQAGYPLQLALVFEQGAIGRVELLHAVTPLVLGQLAGAGGPVQRRLPVAHPGAECQHADAGVQAEWPSLPGEDELLDAAAQLFGLLQRGFVVHLAQQDGELVAANSGQLGMPWQLMQQLAGELPEQLIAGGMATEVVDLLEAVQPQQQQVTEAALGGAAEGFREQPFQFAAVEQAGQRVMCGQLLQALFQRTALAEVDHDALDAILMRTQVQ